MRYKRLINTVLAAIMMATPAASVLAQPKAEVVKVAPKRDIFAGSIVNNANNAITVDSLVNFSGDHGTTVTSEQVKGFGDDSTNSVSLGSKIPLTRTVKLGQALDIDLATNNYGVTAFAEINPTLGLTLRAGGINNSSANIKGGFMGGSYTNDKLTVDLDSWYDGNITNGHGFVGGVIPLGPTGLYVSVGGDLDQKVMNIVTGFTSKKHFNLFTSSRIDLKNNSQNGNYTIIPSGSTLTKRGYDFQSHIVNGTGMRGVATGYILDGWAPFDASRVNGSTDHLAISGNWSNDKDVVQSSFTVLYRVSPKLFLGIGGGDSFDKNQETHALSGSAEAYTIIPGTPLDSWVKASHDFEKGETSVKGYIGLTKSF
jgi:hypothetical protein